MKPIDVMRVILIVYDTYIEYAERLGKDPNSLKDFMEATRAYVLTHKSNYKAPYPPLSNGK